MQGRDEGDSYLVKYFQEDSHESEEGRWPAISADSRILAIVMIYEGALFSYLFSF